MHLDEDHRRLFLSYFSAGNDDSRPIARYIRAEAAAASAAKRRGNFPVKVHYTTASRRVSYCWQRFLGYGGSSIETIYPSKKREREMENKKQID